MKLTGVCLVTNNVLKIAGFYEKVLGVRAEGDDRHMELRTVGAGIAIFSVEGMEEMAPHSMKGMGHGGVTVMFEVKKVDQEYERLKKMRVEMVKPPETYPWGARSFWFRDPDGNIVDFYEVMNETPR